jgi:hypothetical protein
MVEAEWCRRPGHVGVREILQRTGLVNPGGELAGGPLSTWAAVVSWQVSSDARTRPHDSGRGDLLIGSSVRSVRMPVNVASSAIIPLDKVAYRVHFLHRTGSRAVDQQSNNPPTGVSPEQRCGI